MINRRNGEKQCAVCFASKDNEIFVECFMCGLGVHGSCYGCSFTSSSRASTVWKCRFCHAIATQRVNGYDNAVTKAIKCRICNQCKFGALKSCGKYQGFAHLVCALWTPFIFLENSYNMAPIKGIEKCEIYKSALNKLICSICNESHATIKCRIKSCKQHYHPLCLMERYRHCMMERDGVIDNSFLCKIYYVYCPNHVHLHTDWDYNKGHKRSKSREVLFDIQHTNIGDGRPQIEADITMTGNDTDSDIVIIASDYNKRANASGNNEENGNTKDISQSHMDRFECESNIERMHMATSLFMDHTPSPSIPMDIASQWTERLQSLQNPCVHSDRDSVFGIGDNLFLREYSPLMMGTEMTPTLFDHNDVFSNYYDHHLDDENTMNRNGFDEFDTNNNNVQTQTENHSMYLIPKLTNNPSLTTASTNSTFGTIASPHTVGSFSSAPIVQNGDEINNNSHKML